MEWSDTDAAGHHHFTAILRWAEQAETLLHQRLGLGELIVGRLPRVRVECEFTRRLYPLTLAELTLAVAGVGRSSIAYAFEVTQDGARAAHGSVTAVLVEPGSGSTAWPADARRLLLEAGTLRGERLSSG